MTINELQKLIADARTLEREYYPDIMETDDDIIGNFIGLVIDAIQKERGEIK